MKTKPIVWLSLLLVALFSQGCGRYRGISTHEGGKRFFIEQELVRFDHRKERARFLHANHIPEGRSIIGARLGGDKQTKYGKQCWLSTTPIPRPFTANFIQVSVTIMPI